MRSLLTSISILMALAFTGCTSDGASLFIVGVAGLSDECEIDTGIARVSGVVDISLTDNLVIYPLFASQLRERISPNAANPADLHVQFVDVRIEDQAGALLNIGLQNPFRVPTSAFIESFMGTGEVPVAAGAVQVLPPGYPAAIAGVTSGPVLVSLRPRGRTNGQMKIKGNFTFQHQVQVCDGCLSRCATGSEQPQAACIPGQNDLELRECP